MKRSLLVLVPTRIEAQCLFPGTKLGAPRPLALAGQEVQVALTGIGLAAAGVTTARWLAACEPRCIVLLGTCGTYRPADVPPGAVLVASHVGCEGIGAGEGEDYVDFAPRALPATLLEPVEEPGLATVVPETTAAHCRGPLLSVACAAGSPGEVCRRRGRHPAALAEDMESHAVALAAQLAGVPLTVVRGVSNRAGDREPAHWQVPAAMEACGAFLEAWWSESSP